MLAPLGFARRYTRTEREKGGDPSSTVGLARVAYIIHKSQEGFFPSYSSFFLPQSHSMERERGELNRCHPQMEGLVKMRQTTIEIGFRFSLFFGIQLCPYFVQLKGNIPFRMPTI